MTTHATLLSPGAGPRRGTDHSEELLDELEELEDSVGTHEAKSRVRESMRPGR